MAHLIVCRSLRKFEAEGSCSPTRAAGVNAPRIPRARRNTVLAAVQHRCEMVRNYLLKIQAKRGPPLNKRRQSVSWIPTSRPRTSNRLRMECLPRIPTARVRDRKIKAP